MINEPAQLRESKSLYVNTIMTYIIMESLIMPTLGKSLVIQKIEKSNIRLR